jgi:hypothetical protein
MWSIHGVRFSCLDARHPVAQHIADAARDGRIDLDVLVELAGIDVDVNLLRVERVGLDVARHAIVEPHAERDQEIGFLHGRIDPGFAVHAHHPEVQMMTGREAANAEQRHGDRDVGLLGKRLECRFGAAKHDAVAGQDERPLGGIKKVQGIDAHRVAWPRERRNVGRGGFPVVLAAPELRVLGNVDQHRTGTAAGGNGERFANRRRHVGGARHQEIVLGDRQRDAGDVGLLKGVGADDRAAHLSRDADDR